MSSLHFVQWSVYIRPGFIKIVLKSRSFHNGFYWYFCLNVVEYQVNLENVMKEIEFI